LSPPSPPTPYVGNCRCAPLEEGPTADRGKTRKKPSYLSEMPQKAEICTLDCCRFCGDFSFGVDPISSFSAQQRLCGLFMSLWERLGNTIQLATTPEIDEFLNSLFCSLMHLFYSIIHQRKSISFTENYITLHEDQHPPMTLLAPRRVM